jgi:hypothetical protein
MEHAPAFDAPPRGAGGRDRAPFMKDARGRCRDRNQRAGARTDPEMRARSASRCEDDNDDE